jgi:serine/threonine-protein kinase
MTLSDVPEPGTILAGKYQVERALGVGGMGVVVAAKHLQLEQTVAIKFLLPTALTNPESVARFAREARAASKIHGEHVARVIDVGRFDDGSPFMVMEYLEGNDLGKQIKLQGPMPIVDAVHYIIETCEALAEAHAVKIVHRDLKPSNLFLAKRPGKRSIIKVLDFGISKIGDSLPGEALTKTSAIMGTVHYMSPEQLRTPKAVDTRADIWALGIILYELLTGHRPFVRDTVPETIVAILMNEHEPLTKCRPDVPEGLARVIAQCMQLEATNRFANAAQLAQALEPYASPEDRESVRIAARVLGETMDRSTPGNASPPLPMPPAPPTTTVKMPLAMLPPAIEPIEQAPSTYTRKATHRSRRRVLTTGGVAVMVAVALGAVVVFALATRTIKAITAVPTPSASPSEAMAAAMAKPTPETSLLGSLHNDDATTTATTSSTEPPAPPKPANARAATAQPTPTNPKKNPLDMGIK